VAAQTLLQVIDQQDDSKLLSTVNQLDRDCR